MRSLRNKGVDLLLNQDDTYDFLFGDLIAEILFREGEMALLVDYEQKRCRLFSNSSIGKRNCFLRLTDILGTIISLEERGLVFISDKCYLGGLELFYESKEDFHETQIPGEYSICEEQELVLTDSAQSITINGTDTLKAEVLPERMFPLIVHVFCGNIYPTKGLEEYVNRGYRTWEEHNAKLSRIISWIAIGVSIILGIVSIWLKK